MPAAPKMSSSAARKAGRASRGQVTPSPWCAMRASTSTTSKITAPFTGRIGTHLISVGNLVSGSRGGVGATTLPTTIVSLDPIYLDFDMSEADYTAFLKGRAGGARDARQQSRGRTGR